MVDALIQGILLGGYYAILAAGLALMFGVVRFINLAHGDLAVLGAYGVLFLVQRFELSPLVATLITVPLMGLFGWFLQAALFARTLRGGILLPLLTTFGLGAVLENGIYGVYGADAASLGNYIGDLSWESYSLPFDITVGKLPVLTFAVAVVVLVTLQLLLSYTRLGRAIRAASLDPEAAELSGVNATRVYRWAAAIAVALAGLAGVFLAMRALINPYSGPTQLIYAFEAVVIGGIGSIWGTLIGGIILGIAQSLGALYAAQWFQLAGHLVFFAVLAVRFYRAKGLRRPAWLGRLRRVFS